MCKRVCPCVYTCPYVFKQVYLTFLHVGRLVSVDTQVCAFAHMWEYGGRCRFGLCGLTRGTGRRADVGLVS